MSSTQRLPKYFYRIHNKIISIDFDVPFLPKLKTNINPDISFTENEGIFNSEFEDGYILDKDKGFYSKAALIQTNHTNEKTIEYFLSSDLTDYDRSFKLLSHPMALSLVLGRSYVLHSSAIEIDKKAYIFIGPSGSGKSFIVNSLLKYGRLMTEDILSCAYANESFFASPSIPVIKLQQNELISNSKNFEIFGDTRNRNGYIVNNFDYENKPIKIEACFILKESMKTNISKCEEIDAYRNLFLNSFCAMPKNKCLDSEKNLMNNISLFIKNVPVYHYERKKDHNFKKLRDFLKL